MQGKTIKLLYKMVIEPTMTYGLKCAALTKANRSKLRRYERMILRDMLDNAGPAHMYSKIHDILDGKTITKRIKCLRMCYYGHILRRRDPHLLHAAYKHEAKNRKIGRPIYTWKNSLQQDMEYYKKSPSEWIELATDKKELISAAREIYKMDETDSEIENDETVTNTHNEVSEENETHQRSPPSNNPSS